MGHDHRPLEEIIAADTATVEHMGYTLTQLSARMREITDSAKAGLEMSIRISERLEARVIEARGRVVCPWPHPGTFGKTVTKANRTDMDLQAAWSDLSIHMVEAHGFFEGFGSTFRLDPETLITVIFG